MSNHAAPTTADATAGLDLFDPPLQLNGIPVRDAEVRAYAGDKVIRVRSTMEALELSVDETITGEIVVEVTPHRVGHSWVTTLARNSRPATAADTVAFLGSLDPLQLQAALHSLLTTPVSFEEPTEYLRARLPGRLGQMAVVVASNGALVVPAGARSCRILDRCDEFLVVDRTPRSFADADRAARRLALEMRPGRTILVSYDPAQVVVATLIMHHWLAVPVTSATADACRRLLARQRTLEGRAGLLGASALFAALASPLVGVGVAMFAGVAAAGLWSVARRWSWWVLRTGGSITGLHQAVWGDLNQDA